MRTILSITLFVVLPMICEASVSFSEIAWMGSTASANHEWIELYNAGSDVSVEGWQISDGQNLQISLAGMLPGGTYSVLERTSEASAPGTAFLIYTGALVNTGATLTLTRADGTIVDQMVGGENWQGIGDNVTKETGQYTASGWVTGPPTPGAQNVTSGTVSAADSEPPSTSSDTNQTFEAATVTASKTRSSASETVRLELADVTLTLAVDAQSVAYVHQAIDFTVTPSGIGKTQLHSLTFEWNFGDGATATGKTPTHAYAYPGKYVVTVYGAFGRHKQVVRHEITVLPVSVQLDFDADGTVRVHNTAPYEIDISGFVVSGTRRFTFPPRSIVLPNQTITLPPARARATLLSGVYIHDTEGVVVASAGGSAVVASDLSHALVAQTPSDQVMASVHPEIPSTPVFRPTPDARANTAFTFATSSAPAAIPGTTTPAGMVRESISETPLAATPVVEQTDARSPRSPRTPLTDSAALPYLGMIALLLIAIGGVWFMRPPQA